MGGERGDGGGGGEERGGRGVGARGKQGEGEGHRALASWLEPLDRSGTWPSHRPSCLNPDGVGPYFLSTKLHLWVPGISIRLVTMLRTETKVEHLYPTVKERGAQGRAPTPPPRGFTEHRTESPRPRDQGQLRCHPAS